MKSVDGTNAVDGLDTSEEYIRRLRMKNQAP
jgi:hypothetical protein